jgi:hypothetical protein
MSDLLYAGDAFIKTTGAGGVAWVRRYITITPYVLDWFADPQRGAHIGTVQLAGGALLLAEGAEDAPTGASGSLCVELDWSGQDFLPLYFATADDAHDAVLVRGHFAQGARAGPPLPRARRAPPCSPPSPHTPHTSPPPPHSLHGMEHITATSLCPLPFRPSLPLLPA